MLLQNILLAYNFEIVAKVYELAEEGSRIKIQRVFFRRPLK